MPPNLVHPYRMFKIYLLIFIFSISFDRVINFGYIHLFRKKGITYKKMDVTACSYRITRKSLKYIALIARIIVNVAVGRRIYEAVRFYPSHW